MKLLPRTHGWPEGVHPLALLDKDLQLKAHVAYPRAKAGDEAAALDLLLDMAVAWLYEQRARFAPVPVDTATRQSPYAVGSGSVAHDEQRYE